MSKRPSLNTFAPKIATGGHVEALPEPDTERPGSPKYPKLSVYLTAEEVRTLKLLNVETGRRVSDILAEAVRAWLKQNGHARELPSSVQYKA